MTILLEALRIGELLFLKQHFCVSMLGNGFTRKKVESLTLGEKLRKLRSEYQVSLLEVARHTGIRKEYLEYLEGGEYAKLPADVYLRGFIRSYAQCLGVDSKGLIRLYDRERSIAKHLGKEPNVASTAPEKKRRSFVLFVVTPKMMIGGLVGIFIFGVAAYLYREFQVFVSEPFLAVLEPANGQEIASEETFIVGKTDRDAKLFLNGEPIFVNETGEFRERLRLSLGVNTAEIRVVNRFGKERKQTVSVTASYGIPESAPSPVSIPEPESSSKLTLKNVGSKPVSILVRVDGKDLYQGDLLSGESKEFDCKAGCAVDSTSGRQTLASWNGAEAKPLGVPEGTVIGVVFPEKDAVPLEIEKESAE